MRTPFQDLRSGEPDLYQEQRRASLLSLIFINLSSGNKREAVMAVARVSKITASSEKSFQDATEEGLKRATKTLRGVTGFEVMSLKGKVDNGKITEYRVTLEVTFILE
jgi:flavin-binding protein dodecin